VLIKLGASYGLLQRYGRGQRANGQPAVVIRCPMSRPAGLRILCARRTNSCRDDFESIALTRQFGPHAKRRPLEWVRILPLL